MIRKNTQNNFGTLPTIYIKKKLYTGHIIKNATKTELCLLFCAENKTAAKQLAHARA
jgi:oxalate decarboxylase/phosphoglucose isomerase-like protein (cupin superfamily)